MGKYVVLLIVPMVIGLGVLGWWAYTGEQSQLAVAQELNQKEGQAQTKSAQEGRAEQDPVDLEKASQQELLSVAQNLRSKDRAEAVLKLIEIRQEQETLVPALARLLREQDELVRIAAGIVLQKIGSTGAEHLRSMMESSSPDEVRAACSALKEMGGAKLYLPLIRQWLTSDNSETRKQALFALQGSTEGVLEVLTEITGTLDDKDFNVQCMACRVLVSLGPDAIDATPQLLELHKTGIPSARSWATIALGAIGPNTEFDTAKYLSGTLDAFIQTEKQRGLEGLALMGPEASSAVEMIREVMRDEDKHVMHNAAYALWKITGETEEPIKVLSKTLDDPSYTEEAMAIVGKMGDVAKPLVGKLVTVLTTGETGSQEIAIVALGNIGPVAAEAIPTLKAIAADKQRDALIRYYAKEAIQKIQGKAAQ